MSQDVMSPEKIRNDEACNDLKPFCPVHHWRMAHDAGSTKIGPSYHCNYDGCTVLYTQAQGYFDLDKTAGGNDFVVSAEILCCTYNPEHHPAIVGYAKESLGSRTEESRHWQCLAPDCNFSLRQKLSPAQSAPDASTNFALKHAQNLEHAHLLWPR